MATVLLGTPKVTSKGQATIPVDVRRELGIEGGDRVMFTRNDDGDVVVSRYDRNRAAWLELIAAFDGAAEEAGLETVDDVVDMVKRLRRGEEI